MDQQPLACETYDHLELACLRRQPLRITLVTGEILTGTAVDVGTKAFAADPETHTPAHRGEYLLLTSTRREPPQDQKQDQEKDQEKEKEKDQAIRSTPDVELRLLQIERIETLTNDASFKALILQPRPPIAQ